MKLSSSTLAMFFLIGAFAACTTLPPASMPPPTSKAQEPDALSFVGSRQEASRLAVEALQELGLSLHTVNAEAGFVGATSGLSTSGLGERIGIYFREHGDGSMQMWVVAVRKSKTNPEPPRYDQPVRRELKRRIASLRSSASPLAETGQHGAVRAAEQPAVHGAIADEFSGEVTGACFLAGPDGEVLSTHRAIAGATAVRVHLADGRILSASVARVAPALDLALLQIATSTPGFLALAEEPGLEQGLRVFNVAPSSAWSQPGGETSETDEGTVQRTVSPTGERSRFETTIAAASSRYGTPVINRNAEIVGVITAVPASVRVMQSRGELDPDHSWAVNLTYAKPMLPAVSATPATSINEAVSRARAALCQVEAQFQ